MGRKHGITCPDPSNNSNPKVFFSSYCKSSFTELTQCTWNCFRQILRNTHRRHDTSIIIYWIFTFEYVYKQEYQKFKWSDKLSSHVNGAWKHNLWAEICIHFLLHLLINHKIKIKDPWIVITFPPFAALLVR